VTADLPARPVVEVLEVSTPGQFKGLSHPLRQRLLFALGQRPATVSQLAAGLKAPKGNVAHHLKVLHEAGLVVEVGTRQVRGGTERYFQRAARRLSISGHVAGPAEALLGAVAQEIESAPDEPLLAVRHVRLSPADAQRVGTTLSELVAELSDAGDDEPNYGVLVGVYQQASVETDRAHR
jgi:DNA-binding transcriptional ArsR family regulator